VIRKPGLQKPGFFNAATWINGTRIVGEPVFIVSACNISLRSG